MIRCGNCKSEHDSVENVKICYRVGQAVDRAASRIVAAERAQVRSALGDARTSRRVLPVRQKPVSRVTATPPVLAHVVIFPTREESVREPLPHNTKVELTEWEQVEVELEKSDREDQSFSAPTRWDRTRSQSDCEVEVVAQFERWCDRPTRSVDNSRLLTRSDRARMDSLFSRFNA